MIILSYDNNRGNHENDVINNIDKDNHNNNNNKKK